MVGLQEKKVDSAISFRKVMTKEFLSNQSNQLEEYLFDLGATINDVVTKINIALKKEKMFQSL